MTNMPCRNTAAERDYDGGGDAPAEQEAHYLDRYAELTADSTGIAEIVERLRSDDGDRLEYALLCELRTNPRSAITRLLIDTAWQMAEEDR